MTKQELMDKMFGTMLDLMGPGYVQVYYAQLAEPFVLIALEYGEKED